MRIELAAVEVTIENDIAQGATQKRIAELYAMAIVSSWPTEWRRVNGAIQKRWPKGLVRVKEMAWRIVNKHRSPFAAVESTTKEKP